MRATFTTGDRDRRAEAGTRRQAELETTRRGLGERLTSRGPDAVDRARTAEASARLEFFLSDRTRSSGLHALEAVAQLAHLAASGEGEVALLPLLSDAGVLEGVLRLVGGVLLTGLKPPGSAALLEQLRELEAHVPGLPEADGERVPTSRLEPAAEIRRLRALLIQMAFDLERLALQPTRTEEDQRALHDRAQAVRWGLSLGRPGA